MKNADTLIGVDIGGTKCAVCAAAGGEILDRRQFPTVGAPEEVLGTFAVFMEELRDEYGKFAAIGISCGGPLDSGQGLILSPPNLPGWDKVPVNEFFEKKFNVPVFLQNDANACALAEWRHGAGRGARNMMFCTMGTGFGCGLILDGRLYEGTNGNAGELGHVRLENDGPVGYGKKGSVEGFCSGAGIERISEKMLGKRVSAKDLAVAARKGNEKAVEIYRKVGAKLGKSLAIAVDFLNLERIVIGSIFARDSALIREEMERVMREECLECSLSVCSVLPAELGDGIGDWAALTVAENGLMIRDREC